MKLHLLSKMLLFILLPALFGLCLVTGLGWQGAQKALTAQVDEEMTLVVEDQRIALSNITEILHNALRSVSLAAQVRELLQAADTGASVEQILPAVGAIFKNTAESFTRINTVGLADARGVVVQHTNPKIINYNISDRPYFQQSLRGLPSVMNTFSRDSKQTTTIFSVPVKVDGKILGVLYANLDVKKLATETADRIKIGKTGFCFVLADDGLLIMHPDKSMVGGRFSERDWVRRMISQGNGNMNYQWEGIEKEIYFRSIPDFHWIVAVTVEREDLFHAVSALLRTNMAVVLINALIVGLIIFFVARSIVSALQSTNSIAERVSSGELDFVPENQPGFHAALARNDEIGSLARSIRGMLTALKQRIAYADEQSEEAKTKGEEARVAMEQAKEAQKAAETAKREGMLAAARQLEEVADVVSSSSTELAAQIGQSERGSSEQAARITETATAMEEMNSTVLEVAKNAGQASDVSARTREKAASGAGIVHKAVESIRQVQRESLELKEDMVTLDSHAQAISRIMSVISDIADQTNLLALNAAIEAARAGEAGRGFAVVADEVRKLAEKTMASTTEVGQAIKGIQDSTDKSVAQVDKAVKVIEQATEYAAQSGQALQEIVTMAESTADQVRGIATASEQQSASSEEINQSITKVNTIAGETARAMGEASRVVSELAAQAQVLMGLIEDMKRS